MRRINPDDNRSAIDMSGQKFNRWTVLSYAHTSKRRMAFWNCRCECGTERVVDGQSLRNGRSKSCGCWNLEVRSTEGGLTMRHRGEYDVYRFMLRRCTDPENESYEGYGGRGITICDRWLESFTNFFEDMGPRPTPKHQLDRIDNNGNYCKENCRWTTKLVQANNTRTNKLIEYNGETKTLADWARQYGLTHDALQTRLSKYQWPIEKALTTKARPRLEGITYQGKTQTLIEWSKELGIHERTLRHRLKSGLSLDQVFSQGKLEYGLIADTRENQRNSSLQ